MKYRKYYFGFIETEQNLSDPNSSLGYVVCIMDTRKEGFTIPRETEDGTFISTMPGYAVGGIELGGLILE